MIPDPPLRQSQSPLNVTARYTAVLIIALFLLAGCKDTGDQKGQAVQKKVVSTKERLFSTEEMTAGLQQALARVDTLDSTFRKNGATLANGVAYTYQLNGYKPVWVEEKGITEAAGQFLGELDSLRWDGLDPEKYHYTLLKGKLDQLGKSATGINAIIHFDTLITSSYLHASRDLLMGVVSPKTADDQWFHTNDTAWNGPQTLAIGFARDGKYPSLNNFRSDLPTYRLLRNEYRRYQALSADPELRSLKSRVTDKTTADTLATAIIHQELPWLQAVAGDTLTEQQQLVRGYQDFYGLNPTGKMDSLTARYLAQQPDSVEDVLRANMERLRWLPRQMEDQYVLVNIPLMELFYRKGTENAFHMKVVVGKPSRQTPALNAMMANVVFSPPWGVPPTILKKEVLPGIAKRGGSYLSRRGLRAYDRRGRQVNVAGISAKSLRGLSFRQPPGARNALGEVKFNLPNKWDIYLHDTPHKEDFPRRYRAKSSGCVRVERPRDFAEFILKELEGRNFDQAIIDSIIQTRRTQFEQLEKKIPVHLIYLTAFEDTTGQRVRFLADIYHRDNKLIARLNGL